MIKKWLTRVGIIIGLVILGVLIYIGIGLASFSNIGEKRLIFSLIENDVKYEMYYVFQGALGQDGIQTVIDGEVYANETIREDLNYLTVKSITIKDSISICLSADNDTVFVHIPLKCKRLRVAVGQV